MAEKSLVFAILAKDNASDKFEKVGKSAEKSGGKFAKLGKMGGAALAGLGVAAGAAGLAVAKGLGKAFENEKLNDRLAASLGATPKQAERFGKVASRLYAGAWGESMADVTTAVEAVGSSFNRLKSNRGLEKVTAQALDFASIFQTDVPRATQVASTVMKSGLAKSATEAFDLMTAASQRVPSSLREDVMDAAEEYSQFFKTVGFDGEQTFALLAKGAEKGQYGIDKIGDAVKEFTIRSTDMSTSSKDAYTSIGLDAGKMANSILAGGKTAGKATSKIVDGLLNIKDPAKQAEAAIALFGTPLEDLNVKDIPQFLQSMKAGTKGMDNWKGSIDRAGKTLNDNASTNITAFKRQVETTFVNFLGGKALPAISKFAAILSTEFGPTVVKVGNWAKKELLPPLRDLATKYLGAAKQAFAGLKNGMRDAQPLFSLLGKIATTVLIPALGQLYKVVGPALKRAFEGVGRTLGTVGKIGLWLWNNVFRVVFRLILGGIGGLLVQWGKMLQGLGKVPGFGWAKAAGEKMEGAGNKALELRDNIKKIPNEKAVRISTPGADAAIRKAQQMASAFTNAANAYINAIGLGGLTGRKRPPGYARGTNYHPGGWAIVGESGAELVNLPRGSKVLPHNRSVGAMSAVGGGEWTAEVHIHLDGETIVKSVKGRNRRIGVATAGI